MSKLGASLFLEPPHELETTCQAKTELANDDTRRVFGPKHREDMVRYGFSVTLIDTVMDAIMFASRYFHEE